ncbi:MAG: DUF4372 domain-containing protein [Bacteroidales bacterium]
MGSFVVKTQQWLTNSKNTNFSRPPILNQLIMFLNKDKIRKITKENDSDRYVKKFSTYNHVVVVLFVAFEGYHYLREVVQGLLALCCCNFLNDPVDFQLPYCSYYVYNKCQNTVTRKAFSQLQPFRISWVIFASVRFV